MDLGLQAEGRLVARSDVVHAFVPAAMRSTSRME